MEDDCVFCKIVRGELPCHKIWEDDKHLAFLDINPYALGHTMIIPKNHSRWVWDIGDSEYVEYMLAVKKVANLLMSAFHTDIIQEIIGGLGVAHTHIHLLPRIDNDGLGEIPVKVMKPKPDDKELSDLAKKIRE
jgi:histidine triad (HIT) family protein